MYMSYCRYEGTRMELQVCLENATEHINGEAEDAVSDREIEWFRRMVGEFAEWLQDMALLDENGYLDEDALDEICESMKHTCEDEEEYPELDETEVWEDE